MSSLPKHLDAIVPVNLDLSQWLTVQEAARRMDMSAGHARRLCADKWAKVAMAMQQDGQWLINVGAHPSLSVELAPSELMVREDFKALPPAQQTAAMQRAECVRRFRNAKAGREGKVQTWLPAMIVELDRDYPGLSVSRSSLYRWDKKAGTPIDVAELIDWRGWAASEQGGAGSPEAWKFFATQFCDNNEPSLRECWKRTSRFAAERGLSWCSAHSCKRQLDQRIPKEQQVKYRRPAEWRSKYATFIQQHPDRHAAGDCWIADHRPLDLICKFEGEEKRPVITAWIDWRTRKVLGWHLSVKPNTDTILAAFAMAVRDPSNLGPPRIAWMDHGKDFESRELTGQSKRERQRKVSIDTTWFGGVFGALGIEAHFSIAHNPQGKARCERWFATMAMRFDKQWATYTGRDPTRKPDKLTYKINHHPQIIPDFALVRDHVADFIAAYNADADHAIDDLRDDATQRKLAPAEAYAAWTTPRQLADPTALDLCLMPHTRPVTVGRQGVRVSLPGCPTRYYGQFEAALRPFKGTGRKVFVAYDPADTRQVQVRDENLRLICVTRVNRDTGVYGPAESRDALKSMMREKTQYNRALKIVRDKPALPATPDHILIAQHAAELAEKKQPTVVRPDPNHPLRLVQTPFDGQSNELKTHAVKQAAGAESLADPAQISPPPIASGFDDDDGDIAPPTLTRLDREEYE